MDATFLWELFGYSILAGLIAGAVCPLVGCFLLVRRTGFYGITLPQFAAAGVSFAFVLLPWWIRNIGLADLDLETALESPHAVMNYHLSWAAVFTFAGLGALIAMGRRKETETARVAASFAIASAATLLLAQASPTGMEYIETLLRGEIVVVDVHEFETIAVGYGVVALCFALFHRRLLAVSYDRSTARVLGISVSLSEALLLIMTGLTVSIGVWVVGPVVLFGLLVLPPLAARNLAGSMRSFYGWACALGIAAAVAGIWISFQLDWSLGPSVVGVAAVELVPCWLVGRLRG